MSTRTWTLVLMAASTAWLTCLVMTAAMAAVIFPTMKGLEPVIPAFSKMPDSHWTLAAGAVMRTMFLIGDVVQVSMALVCSAAMLAVFRGYQLNRTQRLCMAVPLTIGAIAVVLSALWLSPRMRSDMDEAMGAARAGNVEIAAAARARFGEKHPTSRRLLETATVSTLLLGIATLVCAKPRVEV